MKFVATDISHLNDGNNQDIDGLIGHPFLSKYQKISIDFANKELTFYK